MNNIIFFKTQIDLNPILLGSIVFSLLASLTAHAIDTTTTLKLSAKQLQGMQVAWQKPKPSATQLSVSYPAEVSLPPKQVRLVASAQAGLIEQLLVSVGESVKQGQVIARMRSQGMVSLQSEYLQASTQARLHAAALHRDRDLFNDGIIAQRRFLETQSAHETSQALLNERKQALRLAGMGDAQIKQLQNSRQLQDSIALMAPINGQITELHQQVGARVDPASAIYTISQHQPLWLLAQLPIEQAQSVKRGSAIQVMPYQLTAHIDMVLPQMNKNNQTVTARAILREGCERLSIGQMVNVRLLQDTTQSAFSLPKQALVRQGERSYVFVKTGKGLTNGANENMAQGVSVIEVKLLQMQTKEAIVTGDLSSQDEVATQGLAALKGHWLGLGK